MRRGEPTSLDSSALSSTERSRLSRLPLGRRIELNFSSLAACSSSGWDDIKLVNNRRIPFRPTQFTYTTTIPRSPPWGDANYSIPSEIQLNQKGPLPPSSEDIAAIESNPDSRSCLAIEIGR